MHEQRRDLSVCVYIPSRADFSLHNFFFPLPAASFSFWFFSLTYVPSTELTRTRVHDCPGEKSVFEVFVAHGLSLFFRGVQRSFERTASAKHAHRHTITQNSGRFLSC